MAVVIQVLVRTVQCNVRTVLL